MRIAEISVTGVIVPFARPFVGSTYRLTEKKALVCTVTLADGTRTVCHSGSGHEDLHLVVRLANQLGERLVGTSVFDLERNWQTLMGVAARTVGLGRQRFFMHAVSTIDIALWHTAAVALGQPLCRLLGSEPVPVPTMFVGGYYGPEGDGERDAERAVELAQSLGVSAIKLKVGGGTVEDDLRKYERAARAGSGLEFVCDANGAWDLVAAKQFVAAVADSGLQWLEEPCRWYGGPEALRELRRFGQVPIGAGQSEISPQGAARLLTSDAVDVVNFDAAWGGGVTGWRKVAALADLLELRVAHHVEPHLAMHLLTVPQRAGYVELFDAERDPVWHGMVDAPLLVDGAITAPEAPGIGLEIDPAFVTRHAA